MWGDRAHNDHTKKCRGKKLTQSQKQKPAPKENTNRKNPTNIYTVLMNAGVINQEKDFVEIKNKENNRENKKTIVVDIPEGSTQLYKVYEKVEKQERIQKTAQRDEERHKEFLKNKNKKKNT